MVLKDVTEYEVTPAGVSQTAIGQTLLNGNNIAMVSCFTRGRTLSLSLSVVPPSRFQPFTRLRALALPSPSDGHANTQLVPGGKGPVA
jgi:hypothetical protein